MILKTQWRTQKIPTTGEVDGTGTLTRIGTLAVPAASLETGIVQVASFPILHHALLVSSAGLLKMEIPLGLEDVLVVVVVVVVEECETCVLETGLARSASSITSHPVACATSVMLPVGVVAVVTVTLALVVVVVVVVVAAGLGNGNALVASFPTSRIAITASNAGLLEKVDALEEWTVVEAVCVLETGSANSASSITSLHVISASSALPQNDVHSSPPLREHPGPRRRTYGGSGNTTRDIY
ncbi:uncharacterized protein [Procambarus clarkii]|uniref:uncharacterized protein isoform X4 n=1 Tax=Procambarus clarkii TaxID=6728 RepID=UPI001E670BD8|nr:uncharacterized protein LOC123770039 isoform X4 [Procambarus clarkii]